LAYGAPVGSFCTLDILGKQHIWAWLIIIYGEIKEVLFSNKIAMVDL